MNNSGTPFSDIRKHCITKRGLRVTIRAVKLSDEKVMGKFFQSLSRLSIHKRFLDRGKYPPHKRLKDFVAINYNKNLFLVATIKKYFSEIIIGLGQYWINKETMTADLAFIVEDKFHRQGICEELLKYLITIAQEQKILGFSAEVLVENIPMQNLFKKYGFTITKRVNDIYELQLIF